MCNSVTECNSRLSEIDSELTDLVSNEDELNSQIERLKLQLKNVRFERDRLTREKTFVVEIKNTLSKGNSRDPRRMQSVANFVDVIRARPGVSTEEIYDLYQDEMTAHQVSIRLTYLRRKKKLIENRGGTTVGTARWYIKEND